MAMAWNLREFCQQHGTSDGDPAYGAEEKFTAVRDRRCQAHFDKKKFGTRRLSIVSGGRGRVVFYGMALAEA